MTEPFWGKIKAKTLGFAQTYKTLGFAQTYKTLGFAQTYKTLGFAQTYKTLGFAQTYLLFEKSKTKNFYSSRIFMRLQKGQGAMAKKCHLSEGQLCVAKC